LIIENSKSNHLGARGTFNVLDGKIHMERRDANQTPLFPVLVLHSQFTFTRGRYRGEGRRKSNIHLARVGFTFTDYIHTGWIHVKRGDANQTPLFPVLVLHSQITFTRSRYTWGGATHINHL